MLQPCHSVFSILRLDWGNHIPNWQMPLIIILVGRRILDSYTNLTPSGALESISVLFAEVGRKMNVDVLVNAESWNVIVYSRYSTSPRIPQQVGVVDCGAFVLGFALWLGYGLGDLDKLFTSPLEPIVVTSDGQDNSFKPRWGQDFRQIYAHFIVGLRKWPTEKKGENGKRGLCQSL